MIGVRSKKDIIIYKIKKQNVRNLPILYIHRSGKHFTAQVVKDSKTIAYSSTQDPIVRKLVFDKNKNENKRLWVSVDIAKKLKLLNIFEVTKCKGVGKFEKVLRNFFKSFDEELKNDEK